MRTLCVVLGSGLVGASLMALFVWAIFAWDHIKPR